MNYSTQVANAIGWSFAERFKRCLGSVPGRTTNAWYRAGRLVSLCRLKPSRHLLQPARVSEPALLQLALRRRSTRHHRTIH
jgi:hypothetical protein